MKIFTNFRNSIFTIFQQRGQRGALLLLILFSTIIIATLAAGQRYLHHIWFDQQQEILEQKAKTLSLFLASQFTLFEQLQERPTIKERAISPLFFPGNNQELDKFYYTNINDGLPLYNFIVLLNEDGNILLRVGNYPTPNKENNHSLYQFEQAGTMLHKRRNHIVLDIYSPIYHKGKMVGNLVGEIILDNFLRGFFPKTEISLALSPVEDSEFLSSHVMGTDLYLSKKITPSNFQQVALSPILLLFASIFTITSIGGALHSLQRNYRLLTAQKKLESSKKRAQEIAHYNERLQEQIAETNKRERELNHKKHYDPVTSLPNKTLFKKILEQHITLQESSMPPLFVLVLDLTNFKKVNDTIGHLLGEKILYDAQLRLRGITNGDLTLAHLRADEFAIIGQGEEGVIQKLSQKILAILSPPFLFEEKKFFLGASIGYTLCRNSKATPETILHHADLAMQAAKEQGRNCYIGYHKQLSHRLSQKQLMEQELYAALARREFYLLYQPMVKVLHNRNVKIVGAEALLRWKSKKLGLISPANFIPIAEESDAITPIGNWVLNTALEEIKRLELPTPFHISINLSPRQLDNPKNLQSDIEKALTKNQFPPERVDLEITESILVQPSRETAELLTWLQRKKIRLSLDDFGTGYSSLRYLQKFQFDMLKIDRSFITNIETNQANQALVEAIFAMARALKLEVVTEGIETKAEEDFFIKQNYGIAQGFRYSPPLSLSQLQLLLIQQQEKGFLFNLEKN